MAVVDRPGVEHDQVDGDGVYRSGPAFGPAKPPRWRRKLWIVAVAVAGLFVGVAMGAAAGGGVKTTTVKQTRTVVAVHTERVPVVRFHTRVVTHTKTVTNTVTKTVSTPAASPAASAPSDGGSNSGHVFQGNGGESIGTIDVSAPSTLHWSCPSCGGDNFAVTNSASDSGMIFVNALGPTSGSTSIDPGTYHDVTVNTEGGAWTIVISPG